MKEMNITPVKRLVRETVSQLKDGMISPERAFAVIRFATDGSDEPEAWAQLARFYNNGIGCEKNEELALDALRRSGKVDWLVGSTPLRDPFEFSSSFPIDEDEVYVEQKDENRLVDTFLDEDDYEGLELYAHYSPDNLGCSEQHPMVIPRKRDYYEEEDLVLDAILRPIPYRYVDYEIADQTLLTQGDRFIDHIKVHVYSHPLLTEDADGELYLPARKDLGYEDYWFELPGSYSAFNDYYQE
ncbi:MAG: SEL1-like repeat protein [Bacteroidales bacterium]|nr:SEL1-like repeat protein [Bacteroidales bacterium]